MWKIMKPNIISSKLRCGTESVSGKICDCTQGQISAKKVCYASY